MGIKSGHCPSKGLQVLVACLQFAHQGSGSANVGLRKGSSLTSVALAGGGRLNCHVSADVLAWMLLQSNGLYNQTFDRLFRSYS